MDGYLGLITQEITHHFLLLVNKPLVDTDAGNVQRLDILDDVKIRYYCITGGPFACMSELATPPILFPHHTPTTAVQFRRVANA